MKLLLMTLILLATPNLQTPDRKAEEAATQNQEQHAQNHTKNALASETSPYLLMHASNPVRWYPWGEVALAKAKKENKPIFLSIGYSSCHWCHVMERESFLDDEIAGILNEHFVCIKVDREERPDVDSIYMEALLIMNQLRNSRAGGGWPLSMFLTPDAEPFFGGTYFPARKGDRGASVGFLMIVESVRDNWKDREERIQQDAALVTRLTRKSLASAPPVEQKEISSAWIIRAKQTLKNRFDPAFGGFGFNPKVDSIPKFPQPSNLFFLVDRIRSNPDDAEAKNMLLTTCDRMMMGGIYDHLGGGFHRYSVDRYWRIPHFEKMLYDNGQLASVYTACYELTQDEAYKDIVAETLAWVERELTSPEGGFFSSLDAESEGEEGKFYRWTQTEVREMLTEKEYQLIAPIYSLTSGPNFEKKYYALQLKDRLSKIAGTQSSSYRKLKATVVPILKKLLAVRDQRTRPLLDNKILTSWNGMMIRGFADAGRVFDNEEYLKTASRAADFGLANLVKPDGSLWRTHTAGKPQLNAYVNDYANFINGLIALHKATGNQKWLDKALKLQQKQDELFWDTEHGGYFFTAANHEKLLVRSKNPNDNAVPAGNSVAAENLLYLAEATGDTKYRELAKQSVLSASQALSRNGAVAPRLLISADKLSDK